MPMTWNEKLKMAKEADPTLTDEKAEEVVHAGEGFAHLAWDVFVSRKPAAKKGSDNTK